MRKKLVILGATGSIGTQTLDIIRQHPDKFEILGLSANTNVELLVDQVNEFAPKFACIGKNDLFQDLRVGVTTDSELSTGAEALVNLATDEEVDVVINSLVGFAGFAPTYAALKAGKRVALANKETLVVGGQLITDLLNETEGELIPIDSEHSAMLQCIVGEDVSTIEKIVITASGGPFRNLPIDQLENVSVEQALKHPNWEMGAKITIDSATMMNKGLEIIEAHWLFGLPLDRIEPVIHPQSIIHSIVTFEDGSSKAQLGLPDMKVPIIYALSFPNRLPLETPRMDWTKPQELTFSPVEYERYPCVRLAMNCIEGEELDPAILNASNEVAVQRFLNKEIGYIDIPKIVEKSLEKLSNGYSLNVQNLQEIDIQTRDFASRIK